MCRGISDWHYPYLTRAALEGLGDVHRPQRKPLAAVEPAYGDCCGRVVFHRRRAGGLVRAGATLRLSDRRDERSGIARASDDPECPVSDTHAEVVLVVVALQQ